MKKTFYYRVAAVTGLVVLAACAPRVALEAPEKPIVINVNVKVEQEVRVKLERDVDALITKNSSIF